MCEHVSSRRRWAWPGEQGSLQRRHRVHDEAGQKQGPTGTNTVYTVFSSFALEAKKVFLPNSYLEIKVLSPKMLSGSL